MLLLGFHTRVAAALALLAALGQSIRTENGGLEALSDDQGQGLSLVKEDEAEAFEEDTTDSEVAIEATEWRRKNKKADPAFHGAMAADLFTYIAEGYRVGAKEHCGEVLAALVVISTTSHKQQLNTTPWEFLRADAAGTTLFAKQEAWWHESDNAAGSFAVRDGYRLAAVNGAAKETFAMDDLKGSWSAADPDADIVLSFEAGVDMRGCWGNTIDVQGETVCSNGVLSHLAQELRAVADSDDRLVRAKTGERQRVGGLKDFEVVSIVDEEMEAIAKMGPTLAESEERPGAKCFWSALAPVCAVLAVPSNHTESGVMYLAAQRTVSLPEQPEASVKVDRKHSVSEMDLRGQKFAVGALKRFFMKNHVWRQQDAGFVKAFPNGLELEGCGGREAALALQLDMEALAEAGIVDYQVSTHFFGQPESNDECLCHHPDRALPSWPLVLDTPGATGGQPLRLALAVTDWFTLWAFSRNPFKKTMQPLDYKAAVLGGLFPSYFRMEPRAFDTASGKLQGSETEPAEKFEVGSRVRATRSMAWKSKCADCLNPKLLLNHVYTNAFVFQEEQDERASKTIMDKGKYQVPAGAWGTVKGIYARFPLKEGAAPLENETASLAVEWDAIQPLEDYEPRPVFRTFPEQVMGMPRVVTSDGEGDDGNVRQPITQPEPGNGSENGGGEKGGAEMMASGLHSGIFALAAAISVSLLVLEA